MIDIFELKTIGDLREGMVANKKGVFPESPGIEGKASQTIFTTHQMQTGVVGQAEFRLLGNVLKAEMSAV
jgi:hypothetical protein